MQSINENPKKRMRILAGVLTFLLVFLGIMLVATLNAPTKGGPKVMETMQTYLA